MAQMTDEGRKIADQLMALAKAGRDFPEHLVLKAKLHLPESVLKALTKRREDVRGRMMVTTILNHGLNRHKDAISPEAALLGLIAAKLYNLDGELAALFPWAVPPA